MVTADSRYEKKRSESICRSWPAQTEVTVRGIHFLQEDSPDEIGQAIADWMGTLG